MPAAILTREEVVARVMAVVRRNGYDGASLAELSKATGLGKSSLYHHFPDGKEDMVSAVLAHLESTLEVGVFAPLRAGGTPLARLRAMNQALEVFYDHGRDACLLANLGIGESSRHFHPRVKRIFEAWIDALMVPLREAGLSRPAARARAEDAIVRIEGAVVTARSLDDPALFTRTLRVLPQELLRQ
jgi:AcrR family transcriptional regulator